MAKINLEALTEKTLEKYKILESKRKFYLV